MRYRASIAAAIALAWLPAAAQVFDGLTLEPLRSARAVRLHFDSPDPQLAARAVNTMATAFINLNLERRMEASSYAKTFLQERLEQIKVKLQDSEKSLNEFTRREGIVKPDEKQQSPDEQVLQEFTGALAKARGEQRRLVAALQGRIRSAH